MDLSELFSVGMTNQAEFHVEQDQLALHVGSGSLRVLATPWMIAFMERVSHQLLVQHLPEGYSSVGVLVNVEHLAPTPIGELVRVKTTIIGLDGWQVWFHVEAWDEQETIGRGEHRRFVIDHERFLKRVARKAGK